MMIMILRIGKVEGIYPTRSSKDKARNRFAKQPYSKQIPKESKIETQNQEAAKNMLHVIGKV